MTARRLTALIYILLILATLVHVAVNIYATLGHDVSAIRYMFLGSTNSQTYNGAVIHYQETGASYSYFSLALTLVALALILWQRNKHPMYYADHMKWQLNSLLVYLACLIGLLITMLMFFFIYIAMPFLVYTLPAALDGWFAYRIVRGLWCLGKGRSVYHDGAPMSEENVIKYFPAQAYPNDRQPSEKLMTARRLTTLIYLLLLLSVLVHVAANLAAMLGYDISAIRYGFLGDTESATFNAQTKYYEAQSGFSAIFFSNPSFNGQLIYYGEKGTSFTWLSLPLILAALALILWQRNKQAGYYADHMTWQLNSILGYGGILLLIVASMMFFFLTYLPIPLVILEAWLFYRIVRGLWCLGKEKPVYRHDAPIIIENR